MLTKTLDEEKIWIKHCIPIIYIMDFHFTDDWILTVLILWDEILCDYSTLECWEYCFAIAMLCADFIMLSWKHLLLRTLFGLTWIITLMDWKKEIYMRNHHLVNNFFYIYFMPWLKYIFVLWIVFVSVKAVYCYILPVTKVFI